MTQQQCWRILRRCAEVADVRVEGEYPSGLAFRHGAAVDRLRAGIPLSEVPQQLGHARIDTTTVYTRLSDPERRAFADRRFSTR